MDTLTTRSEIYWRTVRSQGEVNGRWVVEHGSDGYYAAGTMVCEPAPLDTPDSYCFTAPNGKRYMDCPSGCQWTPRS